MKAPHFPVIMMIILLSAYGCSAKSLKGNHRKVRRLQPKSSKASPSPSMAPSFQPSAMPSTQPSLQPSASPSSSPSLAPSSAPTTDFRCFQGTQDQVNEWCTQNNCCQQGDGTSSCYDWQPGTNITICENACNGPDACQGLAQNTVIGAGSCLEEAACFHLGGNTVQESYATVSEGSCIGEDACYELGRNAARIHIGTESCINYQSCTDIASDGVLGGTVLIYDNSCGGGPSNNSGDDLSEYACEEVGYYASHVEIGPNSAWGYASAYYVGNNAETVIIHPNSFHGYYSGANAMEDVTSHVEVGPNACLCDSEEISDPDDTSYCCADAFEKVAAETVVLDSGSCNAPHACEGILSIDGSLRISSALVNTTVGKNACSEHSSCLELGKDSTSLEYVHIQDGACASFKACNELGSSANGLKSLEIQENACPDEYSCNMIASEMDKNPSQPATVTSLIVETDACTSQGVCNRCLGGEESWLLTANGLVDSSTLSLTGPSQCTAFGDATVSPSPTGSPTTSLAPSQSSVPTSFPTMTPSVAPSTSAAPTEAPSVSLSPTAAAQCVTGTETEVKAWCVDHGCCTSSDSCTFAPGANNVTICENSCSKPTSCRYIFDNTIIEANSCQGQYSCFRDDDLMSDEPQYHHIKPNACNGQFGCNSAFSAASWAVINEGSCNGQQACSHLGEHAKGSVVVESGSFIGYKAGWYALREVTDDIRVGSDSCVCGQSGSEGFCCSHLAGHATGQSFSMGSGSCLGTEACRNLARGNDQLPFDSISIGEDACRGTKGSCSDLGYEAEQLSRLDIGNGACSGDDSCSNAFRNAFSLSSLSIDTVACVGNSACYGLGTNFDGQGYNPIVRDVAIESGVCSSGDGACYDCLADVESATDLPGAEEFLSVTDESQCPTGPFTYSTSS